MGNRILSSGAILWGSSCSSPLKFKTYYEKDENEIKFIDFF